MSDPVAARPLVFGEVLFDHFPDGSSVLGGAPFNVAWNLQAFGEAPLFISRIGDDAEGQRIQDTMRDWGMDVTQLQIDAQHPTGRVAVRFDNGEPHYDIVRDSAWDFIDAESFAGLDAAPVIYHGTLALRSERTRQSFDALVVRQRARLFIDVNLRPPWWAADAVCERILAATWAKLNEHEFELLQGDCAASTEPGTATAQQRAQAFCRRNDLEGLILTCGARGAEWSSAGQMLQVTPAETPPIVDTVGAGDAFASVILLGLLRRWPVTTSLQRAQAFAGAVLGLRGATTADAQFYARFVRNWQHG